MYSIIDKKPDLGIALYKTAAVFDHYHILLEEVQRVYNNITLDLKNKDSSSFYNVFSYTTGSNVFHELFRDINGTIRDYIGHNKPLWFQCWLNYDQEVRSDVQDHSGGIIHGYLSIDPKNTTHEYEQGFVVDNEPGFIFIGKGDMRYRVVVNEPFQGPIVTLSFNVYDSLPFQNDDQINKGFFPLL